MGAGIRWIRGQVSFHRGTQENHEEGVCPRNIGKSKGREVKGGRSLDPYCFYLDVLIHVRDVRFQAHCNYPVDQGGPQWTPADPILGVQLYTHQSDRRQL